MSSKETIVWQVREIITFYVISSKELQGMLQRLHGKDKTNFFQIQFIFFLFVSEARVIDMNIVYKATKVKRFMTEEHWWKPMKIIKSMYFIKFIKANHHKELHTYK